MTLAEQYAPMVQSDLRAVVQAAEVILVGRREYHRAISLDTLERATRRHEQVVFLFADGSAHAVAP